MTKKALTQEEISEMTEHRDALLNIRAIFGTDAGKNFFKYLFKHLEVGELPPIGLDGTLLFDKLGSLRPGVEIFKLASEADSGIAADLLSQVAKEKHAKLYTDTQVGQGA